MLKRAISMLAVLAAMLCSTNAGAVVGGQPADQGEYPWTAAIYRTDSDGSLLGGQFCGGSLVAPTVVVTAKHCVGGLFQRVDNLIGQVPLDSIPNSLGVMVGDIYLSGSEGEKIRVRSVHVVSSPASDIAVLVLRSASTVTPVPFASPADIAAYAPGTMSTVTGWGAIREGGPGSYVLLEAQVPIVSDESCASSYPGQINAATMVCAGYDEGGVDTCQGDSGGPIVVPHDDGWLLVGTTWFGDGCARPSKPGVYSEVAAEYDFISNLVSAEA